MKTSTLLGGGQKNKPWVIRGHNSHEFTSIREVLQFCDTQSITKLGIAHSGKSYERREDGWYIVGINETCCNFHSIPIEGQKI